MLGVEEGLGPALQPESLQPQQAAKTRDLGNKTQACGMWLNPLSSRVWILETGFSGSQWLKQYSCVALADS